MTAKQHRRLRKIERDTRDIHDRGYVEGFDVALVGCSPPPLDEFFAYDLRFVWRPSRRWEQATYNASVSFIRGRWDGWPAGQEAVLRAEAEVGIQEIERWLEEAA